MELIQIDIAGGDFFLEVPARILDTLPEEYAGSGLDRVPSADSALGRVPSAGSDGRAEFARAASGMDSARWMVSLPAEEVDYQALAGSGYSSVGEGGALLTRRKPGKV